MKSFKLDDHKITSGFAVPDAYFENLSEKINAKIAHEPKVVPLYRKKNFMYAAAAILIVGLGLTGYNMLSVQPSADPMAIENYLASQTSTEDILVDLLESEDIEKLNVDYDLDDKAVEDILSHNANLEQYILN